MNKARLDMEALKGEFKIEYGTLIGSRETTLEFAPFEVKNQMGVFY
ncbi:hypothetical protein [Aliarcobacter butzleri]|nr:hypothetical protein [Aliarcobacter butzleri]